MMKFYTLRMIWLNSNVENGYFKALFRINRQTNRFLEELPKVSLCLERL